MKPKQKSNLDPEKELEANRWISNYSIVEAIKEFFRIATIPFIISTIFSLLTLLESEKWNPVLIRARDEFIQVTGLKLSFYIIIILVGFSFIVYSFDFLTKFIARFVLLISNVGFVINAVLAGVFLGVIVSGFFGIESNISMKVKFELLFTIFGISAIFYGSTKVLPSRIKKDVTEALGKPIVWPIPFLFGVILTVSGVYILNIEEWPELAGNQTEIACKAPN